MTFSACPYKEDAALICNITLPVVRMTGKELFTKITGVNRGTSSAVMINSLPQLPLSFLLSKAVCIAWSSAFLLELVKC